MDTTAPVLELHDFEKLREADLEEARAIQRLMLPEHALRAGTVTISHEFRPVAAVGGDFLDYFELMDKTIGFYLGDVSGKGLPAALYAGLAVGTLRGVHKTGTSPSDVLTTLNRRLMSRGFPGRYVTIQYAVFDPRSHQLRIASAGMPGPFHFSATGCCMLELSGIPPGLIAGTSYESVTVNLMPGDSVLFHTDGLMDALDRDEEQFGIERLQDLCIADRSASPAEILGKIFSAVESFVRGREQHDDMAAALFHCSG
jgi:sigma-B regulation protein RsbU (phosphoserine phosphatase)